MPEIGGERNCEMRIQRAEVSSSSGNGRSVFFEATTSFAAKFGSSRNIIKAIVLIVKKLLRQHWIGRTPRDSPQELIHSIQFPRKRNIAEKPKDRHFKNMQPIEKGDRIVPLGERPEIPHFPEESANQHGERQRDDHAIITARRLPNERRAFAQIIQRVDDEDKPNPR